ncbi:MAG: hypothetical protein JW704_06390 [Anaerolineaceae bacterium]|nr:hypothetical protein [Anaerolineaceae bacterium]
MRERDEFRPGAALGCAPVTRDDNHLKVSCSNLTSNGVNTYTYNFENRLTQVLENVKTYFYS